MDKVSEQDIPRPKRRKRFLGPHSTEDIPKTSKWRDKMPGANENKSCYTEDYHSPSAPDTYSDDDLSHGESTRDVVDHQGRGEGSQDKSQESLGSTEDGTSYSEADGNQICDNANNLDSSLSFFSTSASDDDANAMEQEYMFSVEDVHSQDSLELDNDKDEAVDRDQLTYDNLLDSGAEQEESSNGDHPPGPRESRDVPAHENDVQQEGEDVNRNQPLGHQRLRQRMHGKFAEPVDVQVNVTRNDLLYMALGMAKRNNFTNVALSHAIALLNNVFAAHVLPSTIHVLDSLLQCDKVATYFFYCHKCYFSFGALDHRTVKTRVCPECETTVHISDLRVANFFVIFDLVTQLQNLFCHPLVLHSLASPADLIARSRNGYLSDLCDGSIYKAFAASVAGMTEHVISFHFSIDGSPLSESSTCSIWPILVAVNELPAKIRMENLLLGGLWFGPKQAKMDLYLMPFVSHLRSLGEGFQLRVQNDVWNCRAYCIGCCADSGARGKVQGIASHSGYFSCNWCTIGGEWIGGAVRFPLRQERPPNRSHEELVRCQRSLVGNPRSLEVETISDEEERINHDLEVERGYLGVNAVSPLVNLPHFDMVDGFFVDVMHCIDLGICKRFLCKWMTDYGYEYYIKDSTEEIDRRIKSLRPPLEFRRMPRLLSERSRFTARENHNWMMYCCVPVLSGILDDKYLKAWLLLVQAVYLLSLNQVSYEQLNVADTLIITFLLKTQDLYDDCDMSFNLHILKHLVAHTLRWGPSWASTAYCFEDRNGCLKRIIHSNMGIPHQIIRAFSWEQSMKILEAEVTQKAKDYVSDICTPKKHEGVSILVGKCRLIGKPRGLSLSEAEKYELERKGHVLENLERYWKIVYNNCAFTDSGNVLSKTDNSVAQLEDKSIVVIRKIFFDRVKNFVISLVSDVHFETLLTPPIGMRLERDDHSIRKIVKVDEELRYVNVTDFRIVCFRATLRHGDYVCPFPNVCNRK